jgi:hypothetical protein
MGVCSTEYITRKDAIKIIKKTLKELSNPELEELLYDFIGSEFSRKRMLKNFKIVSEYDPATQDRNYKGKPNESDSTV